MEPSDTPGLKTALLARRARDGDRAAFQDLYERLAPTLYAWIQLRVGSIRVDPQDVLQEVWLRAVRGAREFDTERDFRGWIFGIAKNVLLQGFRDAARQPTVSRPFPSSEADIPQSITSISSRMANDDTVQRFLAYVKALPLDDRQLLLYCGLEGHTAREAALRMGILPDAANKRWQTLRTKLRESGSLRAIVDTGS